MPDSLILTDHPSPGVAVLTLNRPDKRNALSVALITELTRAIQTINARVLILRGAGPAFCAGLDLAEAGDPNAHERSADALMKLYAAICASPAVTIAQPHGAAMGGGAGLVAACDFAVAAPDLRLAYPEVRRGLVAALVTCLLRRQLSDRVVRELILLGDTIDAPRALALGLVNRVAEDDGNTVAYSLAYEILKGAPGAIARTKRLLDDLAPRPIAEDLQRAMAYHLEARHSKEAAEGIAAFREKRSPKW